jgi:hypothetical protein
VWLFLVRFLRLGTRLVCIYSLDNVAIHSSNIANVQAHGSDFVKYLTDGVYEACHVMIESTDAMKKVTITMGATYDIYKIFIVGNPTKLDSLVEFEILVGK